MARPVVTGLGRCLPMPRSFATLKGNEAYEVKISGNAPERIVIQYVCEPEPLANIHPVIQWGIGLDG